MAETVFSGAMAQSYAEGPKRQVPGLEGLHRMVLQLLSETAPETARLLVLGAGGGQEMRAFAEARPGWRFDGVDPSPEMLALAEQTAGEHAGRMRLMEGTIDAAPEGPFDGATALLTFHFIPEAERLPTLRALHRRLRKGAPLLLAHLSFPQTEPERSRWIARHVAFGAPEGTDPAQLERSQQAIAERLTILSPEAEEAMLREAGFENVNLFYAGLALRGWVASAG